MRHLINVIAIAGGVLIIVLIAVFVQPLNAWFSSVGTTPGLSTIAALAVLFGLGAAPAVFLISWIRNTSDEEY